MKQTTILKGKAGYNGHQIIIWHCKNCNTELNDKEFSIHKIFCNSCAYKRRLARARRYYRRNPIHRKNLFCVQCGDKILGKLYKYCSKQCQHKAFTEQQEEYKLRKGLLRYGY